LVPPILFESLNGVLPLEATLFVIEVKSTLDAGELKRADATARRLQSFAYAPPVGSGGWDSSHEIEGVVPYLIAFESDLSSNGKTEVERYAEILQGQVPAIKGLCVANRGFWFWADERWNQWLLPYPAGEVACFIAAILNTCQRVAATRRQPDFRQYLFG
jgi:hypothetical protein